MRNVSIPIALRKRKGIPPEMPPIDFPYEVIDEYIRGGCSVIYRIKSKEQSTSKSKTGKTLVLKTMLPDEEDPAGEKRFYMEYEFLRAYPHANLIEVLDYFPSYRGNPAYVMEWVEGDTWQTFWRERKVMDHLQVFFSVFKQLCDVLDFIHKHQIIHRDLKPQNILITQSEQLKLIDFGIMKVQDLNLFTNRNSFMGSAYYVAPECLSGDDVSNAADIFSLGVMIYDLLTGTKPFRGHTLAETVYQRLVSVPKAPSTFLSLPEELDPFFIKILHLEPHQRHSSCAEVYDELFEILGKEIPEEETELVETEMDVCTQSSFLHTHFLEDSLPALEANKILHIYGPSGSGKNTVLENLPYFSPFDAVVKADVYENQTQNDLIELILKQIPFVVSEHDPIRHWRSILATALPQLGWKVPVINYQVQNSSILSGFLKIIQSIEKRTVLLLTCVDSPSEALLEFLSHFFFFLKSECTAPVFTVFISEQPFEKLNRILEPREIPFPDVVTLSEFISGAFNQARVPLEVTTQLSEEAEKNLGVFLNLVHEYRVYGNLSVHDGVIQLAQDNPYRTQVLSISKTIPGELAQFSQEQLKHLEWLALNPEGVDINVLKQLTHVDLETLSKTLTIAKKSDLLEFKTGSTQGLIWKRKQVREFLLKSMDREERSSRSLILAQTIEEISQPYIGFSPPLWRILAKLFNEGQEDSKGAEYALRYAKYCFQSAQYHSIRLVLSPFRELPSVLTQHEFWFLLAMAYRSEDTAVALKYGKRALTLKNDTKTTALMAILEFNMGHYKESFQYSDHIFANQEYEQLDLNMCSQLTSLLLASNQVSRARKVLDVLREKSNQTSGDPYAENLYNLTKMKVLEQMPQKALAFAGSLPGELIPTTRLRIGQLAGYCQLALFQYEEGEKNLEYLRQTGQRESDHHVFMFQEELFFYLSFHCFKQVKRLLAKADTKDERIGLLVRLVSQLMTGDPQIIESGYLLTRLNESGLNTALWLPLIGSLMDPRKLTPDLLRDILSLTKNHLPFWSRHQTPRFSLLSKLVEKSYRDIPSYLQMAAKYTEKYSLIMESLRLESIQDHLISQNLIEERVPLTIPEMVKNSSHALQFLTASLF